MHISRRSLFIGAGAMLGAPRKPLVGGHPYVYTQHREDRRLDPILEQVFADMRYAGLDAVELMHPVLEQDDAAARIGEFSRRSGLPVLGSSYSADMWNRERHAAIVAEATLLIGRLANVGGRTLGISVGSAGRKKTPEQLDVQADVLRRIMKVCADNGVVPNLHNHVYEVADGEHDLNGTLARIPEIKLGPDLNWLVRAGVDPVDFIRRHAKRLVYLHLRDQKADGKWSEAMGEGAMDYAAIGRALREAEFAGDMAIELAHERGTVLTRPLRESLKISRNYVRNVMGF
jgi:sugar phosphate isomerase/epimerase